jgi:lysophospholipase L1-like esterase
VIARLKAGDAAVQRHVLIQFGHNDQPGKPGRSTDLATEFPINQTRLLPRCGQPAAYRYWSCR